MTNTATTNAAPTTATTMATPDPEPEVPASLKYANHRPGALFFAEAIQQMGGKLLKYSKEEMGNRFRSRSRTIASSPCGSRVLERLAWHCSEMGTTN
jgi:hypothetical protein